MPENVDNLLHRALTGSKVTFDTRVMEPASLVDALHQLFSLFLLNVVQESHVCVSSMQIFERLRTVRKSGTYNLDIKPFLGQSL